MMRVRIQGGLLLLCLLMTSSFVKAATSIELVRQSRFVAGAVQTGFWINGTFVGAMKSGRMRIDVPPGDHRIEASNALPCDSLFADGGCDENPFPNEKYDLLLVLTEGETAVVEAYMADGNPWLILRQLNTDLPRWVQKVEVVTADIGVVKDRYVSPIERSMAERCLNTGATEECEPYLATYPDGAYVAEVAEVLNRIAAEEARKRALLEALPVDVRLDALLVKIAQAVEEARFIDAVMLYEQVNELPISAPRDLLFEWAETLIAMDNRAGGLEKLYSYVAKQGRSANHYQKALLLMNEIELNLK